VLGACRREGFASINVDLIYGLPRQTPQTFQQTIDAIVDMRPDRIAVFHFAYVPWLKPQQRRIDEQTLPPTPVRMELFLRALRSFTAAGYLQIGMDHFALPDDELARARLRGVLGRNFQGYTVKPPGDLIGLGMSSISEVQGAYAQNEHVLGKYTAAIEEGRFATQRGIGLSNDDRLRRHVIHGLLCNFALDIGEVERRFGIGWDETFAEEEKALREHVDAGFVVRGPGRIEVTEVGRLFIRNICMVFDRYLRRPAEGKQVFSRTL
jgi:oxygen-independent coproporphyrinogen-3 oxidase